MASIVEYEMEMDIKSPAEAFWISIKDLDFLYPKLLPETYESIEILEGNGKSAGTIRLVTYVNGAGFGKSYKSKIECLDEENKSVTYHVLEGDILKFYKFLDDTITVRAKGKGSVVIWSCKYEKAINEAPDGDQMMKDSLVGVFQKLDAYTLSNINKN